MDAGVEGRVPVADQAQSAGGDPFHRRSLLWQRGEPATFHIPNSQSNR